MRRLLLILFILLLAVGAVGVYLWSTTPGQGEPVRLPLSDRHLDLLTRVPASASAFALIPRAPQLHGKLEANPVTRELVAGWNTRQELPQPWLLGGADLVVWKKEKTTGYAFRVDVVRAFLLRAWLLAWTNVPARFDGTFFVVNSSPERRLSRSELEPILRLAANLPEGDALAVQRESARGAFPPMSRPAVSSVRIAPGEIQIVSRARTRDRGDERARRVALPRNAMLSGMWTEPPSAVADLKRLLGVDLTAIVAEGNTFAIYDIDTGNLLPRPKGLIDVVGEVAVPKALETVRGYQSIFDHFGEVRQLGGERVLIALDRESATQYLEDEKSLSRWQASRWILRMSPGKMAPVIDRLGDNVALRLAAPRIYRSARDLRRWMGNLRNAATIEAADSVAGGVEELRVHIASE